MLIIKSYFLCVLVAGTAACGSGGSSSGSPGTSAASTPCHAQIQQSLAENGTPSEIRDDSVTFEDGNMMLIESHVYTDTRVVISFGHEVQNNNCVRWEEGLTI